MLTDESVRRRSAVTLADPQIRTAGHAASAPSLAAAGTLPAAWYHDPAHHEQELDAVFRRGWTCVGVVDDVARPASFMAVETGAGLPVVITRDADGVLHGLVNVCRHRGGPLASGCGAARALSCAYHAWVYRLDGSLARARGMEGAEGFDPADHHLYPVSVATWARFVFVHPDPAAPPLDLGPLAAAIGPYPVDDYGLAVREQHEREFNWKVLVENYSENFHTPFVHPSLIVADWDYPIATQGAIALAWDRPRRPRNQAEEALASAHPGDAAWAGVAANQIDDVFIAGIYFTVFPNLLVSTFPRYLSALHLTPLSPTRTRVQAYRFWTAEVPEERRAADLAASQEVAAQDLDICEAVQRGYSAGVDTNGRLSVVHEPGVHHVHGLVTAALA
jgi:phenylpropionate dioxygenase-like ring-hydroxylating dioxygenase large terminal subunit